MMYWSDQTSVYVDGDFGRLPFELWMRHLLSVKITDYGMSSLDQMGFNLIPLQHTIDTLGYPNSICLSSI